MRTAVPPDDRQKKENVGKESGCYIYARYLSATVCPGICVVVEAISKKESCIGARLDSRLWLIIRKQYYCCMLSIKESHYMRHEEPVISHGVYVVEIVVSKVKMTVVSLRVRQSQADVGLRTRGSGGGSDGECDGDGHQSRSGHRYPTASEEGYMQIQYFQPTAGLGSPVRQPFGRRRCSDLGMSASRPHVICST